MFEKQRVSAEPTLNSAPAPHTLTHLLVALAHEPDQILRHLDVGLLRRPADVVHLAGHALVQDHVEGVGDVRDLDACAGVNAKKL